MLVKQGSLPLSEYTSLYDKIIPQDHLLRNMKELIDFRFVYDELKNNYCLDNGRNAEDPILMFKYLILKVLYQLSDRDLVERSRYDMSLKYFLNLAPEDDVIHPSLLSKFRKLRLKDTNLLDLLIRQTVQLAIEKGIIKSSAIIVDSTHTCSRHNLKSPQVYLAELGKTLRKTVYAHDESMKKKMPEKFERNSLEDEITYAQSVIEVIEKEVGIANLPEVQTKLNLIKEVIDDDLEHIQSMNDKDARVGHKTADSNFLGYKTHIAMTKERIITGAVVTTGEKHDGKELQGLVEKTEANGMVVDTIIGDAAYSEKDNIKYANENKIALVSRLSKVVTHGNRKNGDKFTYNKDAERYVCEAGHMSVKKTSTRPKKHAEDGEGTVESYWFDVEKCKVCPYREGCYKEGAKTKSYSVSIKSHTHAAQAEFQETETFKEEAKNRYMIEAKNSELKNRHGFDRAHSTGLFGMEIQAATTLFVANIKRIIKLDGQR